MNKFKSISLFLPENGIKRVEWKVVQDMLIVLMLNSV